MLAVSGSPNTVAGEGAGIRPGHGRSGGSCGSPASPNGTSSTCSARPATASENWPGHLGVTEHRLHPDSRAGDAVTRHGVTPQCQLPPGGPHQLIGDQPQQRDPGRAVPPAVELPAHALGHRQRGQQPVVPPQPAELASVLAAHLHLNPDAGKTRGRQPVVHLIGECLGREDHRLGLPGRRVELLPHGQVGGRRPRDQRSRLESARQPAGQPALRPEAAGRLGRRQRGQLSQRLDAQSGQQLAQLGHAQDSHRQPGQELTCLPRRHQQPGRPRAGRKPGGKQPVRDPDLAGEAAFADGLGDLPGQLCLAAEVPGRTTRRDCADAWPQHLHLRAEVPDDGNHGLELTCRFAGAALTAEAAAGASGVLGR